MKKLLLMSIAIMAIGALILSGCAAKPTTPTTPIATTAPTATGPIEIIFASNSPDGVGMSNVHSAWMEKITKETGGRVKFIAYWSESLLKDEESFRGVQDGIADVSPYNPSIESGQRLNMVFSIPFVGMEDQTKSGELYLQLLKEFPELKAEFPGMLPYAAWMMPGFQINSTKSLIKAPADLKGKKVGTSGEMAELVKSIGGAPVELTVGDWYMSLERGLLEVLPTSMQAMEAFGCTELTPYHVFFTGSGYCQPMILLFNEKKWNSLPADIQKVFTDAEAWFGPAFTQNELDFLNFAILPKAEGLKHTIVHLTVAETQLWVDAAQPFWKKWIDENKQYGPAQQLVDRIQQLKAK